MRSFLLCALAWFALCGAACAQGVPIEQWLTYVRSALPIALCEKTSPIGACFQRSTEQCEESARSATRACVADLQPGLPATVASREHGGELGARLGDCVARVYAVVNEKHYRETPACQAAQKALAEQSSAPR